MRSALLERVLGFPEVKRASSPSDLRRVLEFQYHVYVEEMGKKPPYANHDEKILCDEAEVHADYFFTEKGDEITACLRLNTLDDRSIYEKNCKRLGIDRFFDYCPPTRMALSTRLMVHPDYRGSQLLGYLLSKSYEESRKQGIKLNFCFCVPSLVKLYQLIGYRKYKENFLVPEAGTHTPLVFFLEDLEFIKKVRSPFLQLAKQFPEDKEASKWFESAFPMQASLINERLVRATDLWSVLEKRHHHLSIALFEGLEEEEISKLLKGAGTFRVSDGEKVIQAKDFGNELFVVLEGAVDIVTKQKERPLRLASLGKGDLFGEISFLTKAYRTADAICTADSEILAVSDVFLEKLKKREPETAAKVLWNLSKILAERVRINTKTWVEREEGEDNDSDER